MSKQEKQDQSESTLLESDEKQIDRFKVALNSFEQDYQEITEYFQGAQKIIRRMDDSDPYDIVLTSIPEDEKEELSVLADRISVQHGKLPVLIKQGQDKYFVYGIGFFKEKWALAKLDLGDAEFVNTIPIPATLGEAKVFRTTELAPQLYEEMSEHHYERTGEAEDKLEALEEYFTNGTQIFSKLTRLREVTGNNPNLKAQLIAAQNKTFAIYEKIIDFLSNRGSFGCNATHRVGALNERLIEFIQEDFTQEEMIDNGERYTRYSFQVAFHYSDSPEEWKDSVRPYVMSSLKYQGLLLKKIMSQTELSSPEKAKLILPNIYYRIRIYSELVNSQYCDDLLALIENITYLSDILYCLNMLLQYHDKVNCDELDHPDDYVDALSEFIDVFKNTLRNIDGGTSPFHLKAVQAIKTFLITQPMDLINKFDLKELMSNEEQTLVKVDKEQKSEKSETLRPRLSSSSSSAQGTSTSGEIKSSAPDNSTQTLGTVLAGSGMYALPSGKSRKRKLGNSQEEQTGSRNSNPPGPR